MRKAEEALMEALSLIKGDRQAQYGKPQENFARIAERWEQQVNDELPPWRVCAMMADLKMARMSGTGYHRDSAVDAIAYLALMVMLAEE